MTAPTCHAELVAASGNSKAVSASMDASNAISAKLYEVESEFYELSGLRI
jgi:hypothetical protein